MLPLWVRTASLWLFPLLAFAYAWATARVCVALANRPVQSDAHWTEQARQLYPRRIVFSLIFLLQLCVWGFTAMLYGWHNGRWQSTIAALSCGLAVMLGSTLAGMRVSRGASIATHSFKARLIDLFTSLIIRLLLLFLWIPAALALIDHPWILSAAATLGILAVWRGAGLYVARALKLARPASARLQAIVARAASSTGVTPRGVFEARMISVNAFAVIGGGAVIFTEGAMNSLTDSELESIAAHELGHLGEPRHLSLARFAPLLLVIGPTLLNHYFAFTTWTEVAALSGGMLVCIFLMLRFSRAVARRGELHADRIAHRAEALAEPGAYARALEKIYRLNLMPAALAQGTHPALYDRMLAAGVQPDYPRPASHVSARTRAARAAAVLLSVLPFGALLGANNYFHRHPPRSQWAALLSLALIGPDPDLLNAAALEFFVRQDYSTAAALYGQVGEHRPEQPVFPAYQARALILAHHCPEAAAALREAQRRLTDHSSPRVRSEVDATATNLADWCPDDRAQR